jgi:hypothetical protein
MMPTETFVRFEKGREGKVGPTFGPYPFVQLTYHTLRVGPEGEDLAYMGKDDDWYLTDEHTPVADRPSEGWSDIIIWDEAVK